MKRSIPTSVGDVQTRFSVRPQTSMREALELIDANGEGVALVLGGDGRLAGIVTDGDVRRAILGNFDFDRTVGEFLAEQKRVGWREPVTAPADLTEEDLLRLMEVRLVRHMPLIDGEGRVVGLALWSRLSKHRDLPVRAVVMAGGFGNRLRPFTDDRPKPLLEVGGKAVLVHIVEQLRDAGIRRLGITTHYRGEQIREHVGDGSQFDVSVTYIHEEEPLGTAGSLSMLEEVDEPLLVVNGDILTDLDFRTFHDFHCEAEADLTLAVRRHEVAVPFGVVEADGTRVTGITEKPSLAFFVNAGIYLLEPRVLSFIPKGRRDDMVSLIKRLIAAGRIVAQFPIHESWTDVGQHKDFIAATIAAGKSAP
jgi:dTDP-glucose pyrophosphorylase/CBS domain-containing protein